MNPPRDRVSHGTGRTERPTRLSHPLAANLAFVAVSNARKVGKPGTQGEKRSDQGEDGRGVAGPVRESEAGDVMDAWDWTSRTMRASGFSGAIIGNGSPGGRVGVGDGSGDVERHPFSRLRPRSARSYS
jgi:hypothetical protein